MTTGLTTKDLAMHGEEIIVQTFTCQAYTVDDNNDGGSWKVESEEFVRLLEQPNWNIILGEWDLADPEFVLKRLEKVQVDRKEKPLTPWILRYRTGGLFPHVAMAIAEFESITHVPVNENRGPHIRVQEVPYLVLEVNSMSDATTKLKSLASAQHTQRNLDFGDILIPKDLQKYITVIWNTKESLL